MSKFVRLLALKAIHQTFRPIVAAYSRKSRLFRNFSTNIICNDDLTSYPNIQPEAEILDKWLVHYRVPLNICIQLVEESESYTTIVKSKSIPLDSWISYLRSFRRRFVKDPLQFATLQQLKVITNSLDNLSFLGNNNRIDVTLQDKSILERCKEEIFQLAFTHGKKELHYIITTHTALQSTSDLRLPHEWYPHARLMKRKIIYHGGPTNSGKTYQALKRLRESDTGIFLGPLRLLALEVYEKLNKEGAYTNLLTGQETRDVPFATHLSCTIEMCIMDRDYDVAVIDEIQMISDNDRGWAWTRALLGLRAKEIHVCGGIEGMEIVKSLIETIGDDFTYNKYERLSKLHVSDESLNGDYTNVRKGDCIVAFSRADIFSIKSQIEKLTSLRCAVIYGKLPPEVRSSQARLFNERKECDVLVATDAIGMGLNLNIGRIIFHTIRKKMVSKRNSTPKNLERETSVQWVSPSNIKQIAGRAGRLSSEYAFGEVTCWQSADLPFIRAVLSWDIPYIQSAGVFPSVEQISEFYNYMLRSHMAAMPKQQDEAGDLTVESNIDVNMSQFVDVDNDFRPISLGSEQTQMMGLQNDQLSPDLDSSDHSRYSSATEVQLSIDTSNSVNSSSQKLIDAKRMTSEYMKPLVDIPLSSLLNKFVELSQIDKRYFITNFSQLKLVSNWLHSIPLTIEDRFVFANAPADTRNSKAMTALYNFAATYALKRPVALNVRLQRSHPKDFFEFGELCAKHNILELYLWLSLRFPKYFIEKDLCLEQKDHSMALIEKSLIDGSMHQVYSHSQEYHKIYKSLHDLNAHILPPAEFGEAIREKTRSIYECDSNKNNFRPKYPHRYNEMNGYKNLQAQKNIDI